MEGFQSALSTLGQTPEKGLSPSEAETAQSFMLAEYNGAYTPCPDVESWVYQNTFCRSPSHCSECGQCRDNPSYRFSPEPKILPLTETNALYEKIIDLCNYVRTEI
ncbi:hypothetical protein N7451_010913 [Penicillium sp. IBT 35674x]|nr:hypothetical protein N7451_010913 [Penicillium sp. IBT 35674x]